MNKFVGKNIMDAFVTLTPYLKEMLSVDVFVTVSDTEKYIAYEPGKTIDIGLKVNDPIKEGSSASLAIKNRQKETAVIPKELYGIPYKAIAEPIFDENNQVIGTVIFGMSLDNQNRLQEIIDQFSASFQQVNSSIQEIASGAQHLSKIGEKLSSLTGQTKDGLHKTDEIIEMIRHVADQTKLLGLNAAIEAARVGEHGRGFAVVAEEIRRLSEESNLSAKNVAAILKEISQAIENINDNSQETHAISQEQAAATEEIAASMQEMTAQLETLANFAKLI
ncbi:MAG: methyl-accepting chemotaxis protein [Peptococcaceae bacterium]|jgi:hypothetical protein|nr:methyl-accepting chemotaxis protein [Peptococcaceae bacterium]